MTAIYVCIGSACHLKGSYDVINKLTSLIKENNLEDSAEVRAKFCMGNCGGDGVSVRIDDGEVYSLKSDDVEKFFEEKILK